MLGLLLLLITPDAFGLGRGLELLTRDQQKHIKVYIDEAAARERLDPALIHAVITVESAYNFKATSRVGARGLMQLMPHTAKRLGRVNALDHTNPRANILAGTRLLRKLINRYRGNLKLALAAYNAGIRAVEKYNGIPPYRETQNYVKKVLRYFKKYQAI